MTGSTRSRYGIHVCYSEAEREKTLVVCYSESERKEEAKKRLEKRLESTRSRYAIHASV